MEHAPVYDEVFDAQRHFRLLLDSMSRPGKINILPAIDLDSPAGIHNASLMTAMALLNADVAFCVLSADAATLDQFIALKTSALVADYRKADFIFIKGNEPAGFIADVKAGTLSYPESSATIVVDVESISYENIPDALELVLKGPGVNGDAEIYLGGLNPEILDAVSEQNLEFPLGIDLILTDRNNQVICIPRSNQFTYAQIK